jgi:hypothetical protein
MSDIDGKTKISDETPIAQSTEEISGETIVSEETKRKARRRRLLRGLAATVPAIVTLQSGTALALANSSNNNCIAETANAQSVTAENSDANNRCSNTGAIAGEEDWVYQLESVIEGGADNIDSGAGTAAGDSYCLLYVDASGNLPGAAAGEPNGTVGYGARAVGGGSYAGLPENALATQYYAVTVSCWTSLH